MTTRVKFWCNSGANIHSERSEILTVEQLGYTEEEWLNMAEEEKQKCADDWAWERLEIGFREIGGEGNDAR